MLDVWLGSEWVSAFCYHCSHCFLMAFCFSSKRFNIIKEIQVFCNSYILIKASLVPSQLFINSRFINTSQITHSQVITFYMCHWKKGKSWMYPWIETASSLLILMKYRLWNGLPKRMQNRYIYSYKSYKFF